MEKYRISRVGLPTVISFTRFVSVITADERLCRAGCAAFRGEGRGRHAALRGHYHDPERRRNHPDYAALAGFCEAAAAPDQHAGQRDRAVLAVYCNDFSAHAHPKLRNKQKIQTDIQHGRNHQEVQGRSAVAECAQDTGEHVVEHGRKNTCVLCFAFIRKKFPILHLSRKDFAWDGRLALKHLGIGLPMAFQFSITAIGSEQRHDKHAEHGEAERQKRRLPHSFFNAVNARRAEILARWIFCLLRSLGWACAARHLQPCCRREYPEFSVLPL